MKLTKGFIMFFFLLFLYGCSNRICQERLEAEACLDSKKTFVISYFNCLHDPVNITWSAKRSDDSLYLEKHIYQINNDTLKIDFATYDTLARYGHAVICDTIVRPPGFQPSIEIPSRGIEKDVFRIKEFKSVEEKKILELIRYIQIKNAYFGYLTRSDNEVDTLTFTLKLQTCE